MVFVSLSAEQPTPLAQLMAPGDQQLTGYGLADCRVASSVHYEVAANWKLVWENSQECYHCSANHPEFIKTFDLRRFYQDRDWLDRQVDYSEDHRFAQTRFELKPGAVSLTMSGRPACRLPLGTGTQTETFAVHLKPTFAVIACPDHVAVMALLPVTPSRTLVDMHWYVRADAVAGEHYDLDDLVRVWDATNRQDWALCERTQQGVLSRHYRPGPLAPEEDSVRAFYACYATMLEEAAL
jgi:Rieske 2Fe-2S family protein